MGYKKNHTPYFDLGMDKFENYTNRLNDNLEEALYSSTSNHWYANALSGWSQESVEKGKYDTTTNPVELVDLGDGISRYKVRIQIVTNVFDNRLESPTAYLPPITHGILESKMAHVISRYPFAFTESTGQKPIIGSKLYIEDLGGTYFVKKIIAPDENFYKLISSGRMVTTRGMWNSGTPTGGTNITVDNSLDSTLEAFIAKIKASPHFKDWTPQSLAGLVSNASSETGGTFRNTIGGDPPSYWLNKRKKHAADGSEPNPEKYNKITEKYSKVVAKAVKGYGFAKGARLYCSWGYWQLQMCTKTGAGSQLATELGIDLSTESGKQAWANEIKKDEVQFAFVSKKIKNLGLHKLGDAKKAGTLICTKFERPAGSQAAYTARNSEGKLINKCPKRGTYAQKIYEKYFKK